MARARGVTVRGARDLLKLTSGPGRLAEAFGITRARDNRCDLTSPQSSLPSPLRGSSPVQSTLWIGSDGFRAKRIRATPRIGISKAADRPLRYLLGGNAFISGRKTPIQVPRLKKKAARI
jgi:DNA-3-methyladenine glycosylase